MRKFEKVSLEEFSKYYDKSLYKTYNIPVRKTRYSAGYDFSLIEDLKILSQEIKLIPTGIKADMNDNEVLLLIIRSSLGFKYNIRMCNQVGVIDRDYYNNKDNEGQIFVKIKNEGDKEVTLKKGEGIIQGIFINYLVTDNEEEVTRLRVGGIGSTNNKGVI
jgi:dUTP pyrophosphatase